MDAFNMQLQTEEDEEDVSGLTEMVQRFMPKFQFEGEAAELLGQAGLQPELGITCSRCGQAERKRTLICDACESSFHLECLKLCMSQALLFNVWLCGDCASSPLGGHPVEPSCHQSTVAPIAEELFQKSSLSKRHRHSQKPAISPVLLPEGDKAGKIRIVFKLKTSHLKGARALANEDIQTVSNRLMDKSITDVLLDNADKPISDHVKCSNLVQQPGSVDLSSVQSSQEASEELLVAHWIRKKKAKHKSMDSEKLMIRSCQAQSSSVDHHRCNKAALGQPENVKASSQRAFGMLEEKATIAEDLTSRKHSGSGLELVAYRSPCFKFDGKCCKQDDDVCRSGTLRELVKEVKDVGVPEDEQGIDDATTGEADEQEIDDATAGKADVAEEGTPCNKDCPMKPLIGVDAYPKHSGYSINSWMSGPDACPSPSEHASTHEKFDVETEKDRGLVWALDDAQKQLWHKDAIEFMELEPSKGSKDSDVDDVREALLPANAQAHVKLDTSRLLQAYAECRERCVIVYKMCTRVEDRAETFRQTNSKVLDLAIERTWSLGEGFYVLLLSSKEAAKEAVSNGTITFQDGTGYAVPYVPCFSPNDVPGRACPVWVTFLHLPIYFRPFLQELAACLGKVLSLPSGDQAMEASDSPQVCICWKVSRCIPESILVEMEGLGSKVLEIEFDLSLLRHLSKSFQQGVASTVLVSA